MKLFPPSTTQLVFVLNEERGYRLAFVYPWKRLLLLALAFAAIGVALLHLALPETTGRHLLLFAGGGSCLVAALFAMTALASQGELVIDAIARAVRLRFDSPWRQLSWVKPFDDFQQVQFYQVVDGHGLHNHWRIELLLKDGTIIKLGYGLLGAFRRSAADYLTTKVSDLMRIPVVQLEKQ